MVEIELSQGYTAIVDDEDNDLEENTWWVLDVPRRKTTYAYTSMDGTNILMHRFILSRKLGRELDSNELTDHIDGNGLNNRRDNLRLANYFQNQANRGPQVNNRTGYKGVYWQKDRGAYRAQMWAHGKQHHGGYFDDPKEAAKAYNKMAKQIFGEFAWLNDV